MSATQIRTIYADYVKERIDNARTLAAVALTHQILLLEERPQAKTAELEANWALHRAWAIASYRWIDKLNEWQTIWSHRA